MRRRVVSNFFFFLPSVVFFKHSVVLFARESSPDASSSIAQIVSRSPIFYDCFVLEQRRSKKNATKKAMSTIENGVRRRSGWFVFFSSLGVVPFRRFRRLRRTPKPSPSERLQKAGGRRREKKKLLKASFFLRPSFLGFQMLTFFFRVL